MTVRVNDKKNMRMTKRGVEMTREKEMTKGNRGMTKKRGIFRHAQNEEVTLRTQGDGSE